MQVPVLKDQVASMKARILYLESLVLEGDDATAHTTTAAAGRPAVATPAGCREAKRHASRDVDNPSGTPRVQAKVGL